VVHKYKCATKRVPIVLLNIDQFFKLFYWHTLQTIYDKTVVKDFTTLKTRCYTTLWNVNF